MIRLKENISYLFFCAAIVLISAAFISRQTLDQYNLKIILSIPDDKHKDEAVFITGNFNGWSPGKESYQLKKKDGYFEIEIKNLLQDVYEFKFTRGTWATVATNKDGRDLQNMFVALRSDTTMRCKVEAWKDDFKSPGRLHTASSNVSIIDTAFFVPQLNTHRRISIYLPPKYKMGSARYPVLYLQDGQNIFDEYTAGFGEWKVDETLDSMIKKGRKPAIIVAIDNGPERLQEYNPFYFEKFGQGKGEAYVSFLAHTLKPFIDSAYRTMPDKKNTIIAGSSMGGLISYYAVLKYPDTFGKAGIFSPSFWTAQEIKPMTDSLANKVKGKLFFYMGALEGDAYMNDMLDVAERLGKHSSSMIYTAVDPEGRHNEAAWRKWFGEFYRWIIADGYNYIIKTKY